MKSNAESKIRTIIREELDFYFSKIEKRLDEISLTKGEKIVETKSAPKKNTALRKKFGSLMESISEGIDLDGSKDRGLTAEMLEGNSKLNHLQDVLTRDYSSLIKKMEDR
jgi:hypothetical protein